MTINYLIILYHNAGPQTGSFLNPSELPRGIWRFPGLATGTQKGVSSEPTVTAHLGTPPVYSFNRDTHDLARFHSGNGRDRTG
ncbi:MAG: hypothetical protein IPK19_17505 [Chloroflexi bacterium]|nr:hypothetical protein [Chloroflexota bacterium]